MSARARLDAVELLEREEGRDPALARACRVGRQGDERLGRLGIPPATEDFAPGLQAGCRIGGRQEPSTSASSIGLLQVERRRSPSIPSASTHATNPTFGPT